MGYKAVSDQRILELARGQQVTTYNDFNLKIGEANSTKLSPINGGLYDKNFFGSVFRDRCNCGNLKNRINITCNICSSTVLPSDDEVYRYAFIDTTVYYLLRYKEKKFLALVQDILTIPKGTRNKIEYLCLCNYKYNKAENSIESSLEYFGNEIYTSLEGLMALIEKHYPEKYKEAQNYINKYIIVSPISQRPVAIRTVNGKKELAVAAESVIYKSIIYMVEMVNTEMNYKGMPLVDKVVYRNMLRKFVVGQIMAMSKLNNPSKQNFARTQLKKRVTNSARNYIVPDITLKPDEVSIPIKVAYEMFKSDFIEYLRDKYQISPLDAEMRYIDFTTYKTLDDFRGWVTDRRVIINRAPSLHKGSIGCYKVVLNDNFTMGLNPLIIEPYGADFDGDSLSITAVPKNYTEYVEQRIGPEALYYQESNLKTLLTPSHEFLLGLNLGSRIEMGPKPIKITEASQIEELLNSNKINYNSPLEYNGKLTCYGRLLISTYIKGSIDDLIGDGKPINAKNILVIMEYISVKSDRLDIIHKLASFGSEVVRFKGVTSLTLNELYLDLDTSLHKEMVRIKNDETLSPQLKLIRISEAYKNFTEQAKDSLTPAIKDRLESSNRIKMKQVLDLSIPKIAISNNGDIDVMETNLLNGLSPDDYYSDAITNRKVVGIKQEGVGGSGYLTRQLVTIGKGFKFQDKDTPDTNSYIEATAGPFYKGRLTTDGHEIDTPDYGKKVKLPSCIFNKDTNLYRNQVSQLLDYYQDSNIGFSFSTTLTEAMTQSVLSIKHNATFKMIGEGFIHRAKADGELIDVTENTYTIKYGQVTEVYPKSKEFIVNLYKFKKGDVIGYIHKLLSPTYKFEVISKLIDTFPIPLGNKNANNNIQPSVSYSPYEGVISYQFLPRNKIGVYVDGKLINTQHLDTPTLYYYPEGATVEKHAKISSDILSMNKYNNPDLTGADAIRDRYTVFRKQFLEANGNVTEDLIEFLYRICSVKLGGQLTYSGVKGAFKELPALSKIAFGYANKTLDNLLENEGSEREDPLDIIFRSQLEYNNI